MTFYNLQFCTSVREAFRIHRLGSLPRRPQLHPCPPQLHLSDVQHTRHPANLKSPLHCVRLLFFFFYPRRPVLVLACVYFVIFQSNPYDVNQPHDMSDSSQSNIFRDSYCSSFPAYFSFLVFRFQHYKSLLVDTEQCRSVTIET